MKKISSIIIFIALVLLGGCYCNPCVTCPPAHHPQSTLHVIATINSNVYGDVLLDDKNTKEWIDYEFCSEVIFKVEPYKKIKVQIRDHGPCYSHVEYMYTQPGTNYLYFTYW